MSRKVILVAVVGGLVVLSGCTGVGLSGGTPDGGAATDGSGSGGSGGGGSGDQGGQGGAQAGQAAWCTDRGNYKFRDPKTGERVSMKVKGVVERDGKQVCKAVWEASGTEGKVKRVEMYFGRQGQYQEIVYYDAQGNKIGEMSISGGVPGMSPVGSPGGSPAGSPGQMSPGGSANSWCNAGQTTSFVDPQTGNQTKLTIKGTVEQKGKTVCKAVWQTDDTSRKIQKMVMFFDRKGSYQRIVYYDGQGNVVNEITMGGFTTVSG